MSFLTIFIMVLAYMLGWTHSNVTILHKIVRPWLRWHARQIERINVPPAGDVSVFVRNIQDLEVDGAALNALTNTLYGYNFPWSKAKPYTREDLPNG